MPGRRKQSMDIRELILQMRRYNSDRAVQRNSGLHRQTVKRYRQWATEQGLLSGPLPEVAVLEALVQQTLPERPPPQNVSTLEPYRAVVGQLHKEGVEMTAILQRLRERGYTGSYSSVRRFVKGLATVQPEVFVRVECKPGEEGQADFGAAGWLLDPSNGQLRRAWAFVMTLAWSRHQYVEFVFDQKLPTWLLLHRHAFEFFGGVPARMVVDNLKAAIVQACFDDPLVQQAYRECAEHYGFLIAPCRPATPQHKGKVEQGGVHYVKRNFLAGREPTLLTQANQEVRTWCNTTAGLRIHGTTREQPLLRFRQTEQGQLHPLPATPYDLAVWKEATVGRDGYVTFDNAYYSVPCRVPRGTKLRIRGGAQLVTLYSQQYELVATHDRAQRAGERITHLDHLPTAKVLGLTLSRQGCCTTAATIGPATSQVVNLWLDDPAVDRLRTAGRLLRLGEHYGNDGLEAACTRALQFGEPAYATVKRILVTGLAETTPRVPPTPQAPSNTPPSRPAYTYARTAVELLGHLFGGIPWS
jgi:transposase